MRAIPTNLVRLPAGAYTVRTVPGSSSVLVFENDTTKMKALAFARILHDATGKSPAALSSVNGRNLHHPNIHIHCLPTTAE